MFTRVRWAVWNDGHPLPGGLNPDALARWTKLRGCPFQRDSRAGPDRQLAGALAGVLGPPARAGRLGIFVRGLDSWRGHIVSLSGLRTLAKRSDPLIELPAADRLW